MFSRKSRFTFCVSLSFAFSFLSPLSPDRETTASTRETRSLPLRVQHRESTPRDRVRSEDAGDQCQTLRPEDECGSDPGCDPVPLFHLERDRKSTRLNSSHVRISYAVF